MLSLANDLSIFLNCYLEILFLTIKNNITRFVVRAPVNLS